MATSYPGRKTPPQNDVNYSVCARDAGTRAERTGMVTNVHANTDGMLSQLVIPGPEHDVKLLRPEHDVKLDPS